MSNQNRLAFAQLFDRVVFPEKYIVFSHQQAGSSLLSFTFIHLKTRQVLIGLWYFTSHLYLLPPRKKGNL